MSMSFKNGSYFYKISNSSITIFFRLIICLFLCISLSGCLVAAGAPLWFQAAQLSQVAVVGTQTYNLHSGGSLKVDFEDNTLTQEEIDRLAMVESISVIPGTQKNIKFAEALGEIGYNITTPNQVHEFLSSSPNSTMPNFSMMTEQEMISSASRLSNDLGTDAIFIYNENFAKHGKHSPLSGLTGSKQSFYSDFHVLLVSASKEEVLWRQKGTLTMKGADKISDSEEIDKVIVSAITLKLLEYTGREM